MGMGDICGKEGPCPPGPVSLKRSGHLIRQLLPHQMLLEQSGRGSEEGASHSAGRGEVRDMSPGLEHQERLPVAGVRERTASQHLLLL